MLKAIETTRLAAIFFVGLLVIGFAMDSAIASSKARGIKTKISIDAFPNEVRIYDYRDKFDLRFTGLVISGICRQIRRRLIG